MELSPDSGPRPNFEVPPPPPGPRRLSGPPGDQPIHRHQQPPPPWSCLNGRGPRGFYGRNYCPPHSSRFTPYPNRQFGPRNGPGPRPSGPPEGPSRRFQRRQSFPNLGGPPFHRNAHGPPPGYFLPAPLSPQEGQFSFNGPIANNYIIPPWENQNQFPQRMPFGPNGQLQQPIGMACYPHPQQFVPGPGGPFRPINRQFMEHPPQPYIPAPIKHFPILDLYNKSMEEPVEEYCPQNVSPPPRRIVNGYIKVKKDSSTSSTNGSGSGSNYEDDDDSELGTPVLQMDSEELKIVIQNFLDAKAEAEERSPSPGGMSTVSNSETVETETEFEESEPETESCTDDESDLELERENVETKVSEEVATDQESSLVTDTPVPVETVPLPLPVQDRPRMRVKTDKGFFLDEDGFVEAYVCGLEQRGSSIHCVFFADNNDWNRVEEVSGEHPSAKRAGIDGTVKAATLAKENGYSKIRIHTDSTFLLANVPRWDENMGKLGPYGHFKPSSWDEVKYENEIRKLCEISTELTVKLTLVDPKHPGIRKAKYLATQLKK